MWQASRGVVGVWTASAILWLSGLAWPISGRGESPSVAGEFVVRGSVTVTGSASLHVSADGESAEQTESLSATMTGEARYVVESNGEGFLSGDLARGNANAGVGGEGSLVVRSKEGTQHATWRFIVDPEFDPSQEGVTGVLDTPSGYCSGVLEFPPIESEGESRWGLAVDAAYEAFRKANVFEFDIPSGKDGWTSTKSDSGTYSWTFPGGSASGSAECTVTVMFIPEGAPQWEAILEPVMVDGSKYADWLPKGGPDEEQPGNYLGARVFLRGKNGNTALPPLAKFTFFLKDVSREPGVCMNFPHRSKPAYLEGSVAPLDLRIVEGGDLLVTNGGQEAETTQLGREAGVAVACHDAGAYGKLKVIAQTVTGLTLVARVEAPALDFLAIPLDENQNHIGDAWEKAQRILDRALPAAWEGALDGVYAGQADASDGLTLYEKYRGFQLLADDLQLEHQRLDPWHKLLFVHEPTGLLRALFRSGDGYPVGYPLLSQIRLAFIGSQGWTGPGLFRDLKRIVNFNASETTHAVNQHGIAVHLERAGNPTRASLNGLRQRSGLAPDPDPVSPGEEGCAYPDPTAPPAFWSHFRPASTLQVDIFIAGVTNYLLACAKHHVHSACAACDTDQALSDFARTYFDLQRESFRRKYTIELSATCAHELGHATGVNHHDPTGSNPFEPDSRACTIRYYLPTEYPADVNDPFELVARGHRPNRFCTTGFNCWGQLRVSDRPSPGPGAARTLAESRGGPARQRVPGLSPDPPVASPIDDSPPRLGISASLGWPDVVAGDPLRVSVHLHGPTDRVRPEWTEGVRISLYRIADGGARVLVLGPEAWSGRTLPAGFDPRLLAVPNVPLSREWLAPPEVVNLAPGEYVLEVSWDGQAFAAAADLVAPGGGGSPMLRFQVEPRDTAAAEARYRRHLAWWRYWVGDDAGALAHAQAAAAEWEPERGDPLAIRTQLLLADVAARLDRPALAVQALEELRRRLPEGSSHAAEEAWERHALLAPRLRILEGPSITRPVRLEIEGLAAQTYVIETARDLGQWSAIATNRAEAGRFEVRDESGQGNGRRYYRVVWMP